VDNTDRYTYQNKTGDSQITKFITKTKYQLLGITGFLDRVQCSALQQTGSVPVK